MDELLLRQMPHSTEAEQAVLGSMLIDAACVKDVMDQLQPDDFYLRQNREIFETIYTRKDEVIHFLLRNCKYWLNEFHFDGFRFDGVTSMLYYSHGLGEAFCNYGDYFNGHEDDNAICYLTLANCLGLPGRTSEGNGDILRSEQYSHCYPA